MKYDALKLPNKRVLEIQKALNKFKITDGRGNLLDEDGIISINTRASLRKFQAIIGINGDENINNETENSIKVLLSKPQLKFGAKETIAVRYVQWRIETVVDGIFGIQTQSAVIKYQSQNDLALDGIVGNLTWTKLIG